MSCSWHPHEYVYIKHSSSISGNNEMSRAFLKTSNIECFPRFLLKCGSKWQKILEGDEGEHLCGEGELKSLRTVG